ncbi:unnamed protein product [Durusdinium trenchii]|uniref:Uncharacterized protein n=1 Tax=Durusdinium trenchii TaxID=1381693 RepID=A0ABP0IE06_9DINO
MVRHMSSPEVRAALVTANRFETATEAAANSAAIAPSALGTVNHAIDEKTFQSIVIDEFGEGQGSALRIAKEAVAELPEDAPLDQVIGAIRGRARDVGVRSLRDATQKTSAFVNLEDGDVEKILSKYDNAPTTKIIKQATVGVQAFIEESSARGVNPKPQLEGILEDIQIQKAQLDGLNQMVSQQPGNYYNSNPSSIEARISELDLSEKKIRQAINGFDVRAAFGTPQNVSPEPAPPSRPAPHEVIRDLFKPDVSGAFKNYMGN